MKSVRRILVATTGLLLCVVCGCGGSQEAEIPENPLPMPTEGPQPAVRSPLPPPPPE